MHDKTDTSIKGENVPNDFAQQRKEMDTFRAH